MALIIQPEWIVFEFLKQERDISADRRDIPQKVFDIISDQCGSPHIGRYDYSKIEKLFDMPVTSKYSMNRLEEMRTGANRFFPTQESGWIEVCLLTNP
jgi:phage baseplate assembly protein W